MGNSTLKLADEYLMPNYGKISLEITSGEGVYAWTRDEQGNEKKCIDFLCGLGVTSLGHCHPAVVRAIVDQTNRLMHVSNLYATGPMAKLAEALARITGYGNARVFFCNSGTETNEAAGKLVRIWAYEKFGPGKSKIVALYDSFHGRTFLSISMTGQPKMQDKFAPIVPGIEFVDLNDIDGLRAAMGDDVCAVIFEVIQAEGGINMMTPEFYRELYRLSKKYHFLRIVDEVQTGLGRTGKMFAHRYFGNQIHLYPEIITLAKALGGGLPIGAVIAKGEVGKYLLPGSHAATFGGNPVVCAAALTVIETIEGRCLLNKVRDLGRYFRKNLSILRTKYGGKIKEVRGQGFMIGVELTGGYSAGNVVKGMYERGVLIGTAGPQVVRFLPPLIAKKCHINAVLEHFDVVLQNL